MQEAGSPTDQKLCVQSLEQGSNNLQTMLNRLQDIAALSHGQGTVNIMPFDIVAVITGVAEYRQQQTGVDGQDTSVVLELDPKLPLSVEGDLAKVSSRVRVASRGSLADTFLTWLVRSNRS